ncbi:MAG TPA: hypothetical protein VGN26_12715 [Armatimonadota bacterium]|jgi:hypothetical protein
MLGLKWRVLGWAVMAMGLLQASADAAELRVTSSEPGNVFLAGQQVRLRAEGADTPATLAARLVAYDGRVMPAGAWKGTDLNLGALPRGWYRLTVTQGSREASAPIAVVARPRPSASRRVAVDAAHAWLVPKERLAEAAEMLRRTGLGACRERLSTREVAPEAGKLVWGRYDTTVDSEAKRGLSILEVFHDTPAWARKDHAADRFPDDLRDAFRLCSQLAKHYKGRVEAWEVWNEPDIINFSPETGAECAAFQKACYLGLHEGDPKVLVSQPSLAMASPRFHEALYRNGSAGYLDLFNYHIYDQPANYAARAAGHFAIMDRYGVPKVPIWLTEAGIPLRAVNNTLTPEDERRQAEFLPKSFALSLAAGTDRHFFFVFPHYLENGIEFGLLDPDLKARPGYAALATVADQLGEARYLGSVSLSEDKAVQARLFDNGEGQTLVLWKDGPPVTVRLPNSTRGARAVDVVGAERELPAGESASLSVGPSPLYLRLPKGALKAREDGLRRKPAKKGPAWAASPLVLRLRAPQSSPLKSREAYAYRAKAPVTASLEVYNFGSEALSVEVKVAASEGGEVSEPSFKLELAPMGREVRAVELDPGDSGTGELRTLTVTAEARRKGAKGAARVKAAPAVLDFRLDISSVAPRARVPLVPVDQASWMDSASPGAVPSHKSEPGGVMVLSARFPVPGDRWSYPYFSLPPGTNLSPYGAIAFDYSTDQEGPDVQVRLMLAEKGGAMYFTEDPLTASKQWRHAVIPLGSLVLGGFSPADPNGRLDLDQVTRLVLGFNTRRDEVTLRVRNLELLRFGR